MTALTEIRDLPTFPDRAPDIDDHTYLQSVLPLGPLVKDRISSPHLFSHAGMLHLLDDAITRQMETEALDLAGIGPGAIRDFYSQVMLFSNGDVHRNRRAPLARAFAFPIVKAMRGDISQVAADLITPLLGTGPIDFLDQVAGPLPARIIAGILDVPASEIPHFSKLVYSSIRALSSRSAAVLAAAEQDLAQLNTFVADILADNRSAPRGDFLTAYLARVKDSPLSEAEIRIQIVGLILAGSDTTRSALAASFARLLQRPDQWALMTGAPEDWKVPAVNEGLRFDPVVGSLARIATTDFAFENTRIYPGTVMNISILAALRDPAVYANPHQFDIRRDDHPGLHPVFGGGPHRCLGEALARVELEQTLATLARLSPSASLQKAPTLRGLTGVRGIDSMTVTLPAA